VVRNESFDPYDHARTMTTHALVWFRRDLRLHDNPAWASATASADRVTALYVLDPFLLRGGATFRVTQLFAHLHALDESLQRLGGRLLVRAGEPGAVVSDVAMACGTRLVCINADVTSYARRRDQVVEARLGATLERWWGNLVHAPGTVVTAGGQTSKVFTPFATKWAQRALPDWPEARPTEVADDPGQGVPDLTSDPFQAGGEDAAQDRLFQFAQRVDAYDDTRDLPAAGGTSILSADLHFGTLAPRTIIGVIGSSTKGRSSFLRQLAWRDWYAHLLSDRPSTSDTALRSDLGSLDWENDPNDIAAWRHGQTGYPLVDAGMRQLAATGWMHNRVRMVAASFLVKDLLVDWRIGERWFRRLLVDGDVAQNAGNWQWVAGTGPDAAPYFRVFNPVVQSRKFDPDGAYIRTFVPELARVPPRWIHSPWSAPALELAASDVKLGETYPFPLIEHDYARRRALAAYKEVQRSTPA
jgi:deoxyribodipyrimidine photo-lyase